MYVSSHFWLCKLREAIKESTKTPKKVRFHSCSLKLLLQHLERTKAERTDDQLHYQFTPHSQRSFYTCRRETGVTRENRPEERAGERSCTVRLREHCFFRTSLILESTFTQEISHTSFFSQAMSGRTNRAHWGPFLSHCF